MIFVVLAHGILMEKRQGTAVCVNALLSHPGQEREKSVLRTLWRLYFKSFLPLLENRSVFKQFVMN